jgi:penicillin-insensitive murein endopeptidase
MGRVRFLRVAALGWLVAAAPEHAAAEDYAPIPASSAWSEFVRPPLPVMSVPEPPIAPAPATAPEPPSGAAPPTELEPGPTPPDIPGDSVSCGHPNRGRLWGAVELAPYSDSYQIPITWRERGVRYGTRELVQLIARAASRVALAHPGSVLGVADLSLPDGGACAHHRSHQSGRDVDLLYYATDAAGAPVAPDPFMPLYNRHGIARSSRSPTWARSVPERRFDLERNWTLIRVLITDPEVEVERIFVAPRIERMLLDYARASGEDDETFRRAQLVLTEPRRGERHEDHLHVRIACTADDVRRGYCRTETARGPRRMRWRAACPRPDELEAALERTDDRVVVATARSAATRPANQRLLDCRRQAVWKQ